VGRKSPPAHEVFGSATKRWEEDHMKLRKLLAVVLAAGLVTTVGGAAAGAKKKPKPYKSEDGVIAVGHTLLYSSTGEVNSVTAKEFENSCAIPASNGLDAYVYEVPAAYQKLEMTFKAVGKAQVAWDLYGFFYDKDCKRLPSAAAAQGAVTMADATGVMPAGTAYVLIANFAGDPVTVHYELTAYQAQTF
jgi:hypothetical protein